MEANLTFCKCQYRGYGERNPHQDKTQSNRKQERKNGGVDYVLSGFAKALKNNSLNFNEGISGRDRIVSYSQISPLSISEPMTWEDLDDVFSENEIVIDGNGSRK